MKVPHMIYTLFKYKSKYSNLFQLGDIVINDSMEGIDKIGVIIQIHDEQEYRTDMFGNTCASEIRLATMAEIEAYRPQLIENIIKGIDKKDLKFLNSFADETDLFSYLSIGFCQPKFYLPTAWSKAKKLMNIAVKHNLTIPWDFGRGKGKFTSNLSHETILQKLIDLKQN